MVGRSSGAIAAIFGGSFDALPERFIERPVLTALVALVPAAALEGYWDATR